MSRKWMIIGVAGLALSGGSAFGQMYGSGYGSGDIGVIVTDPSSPIGSYGGGYGGYGSGGVIYEGPLPEYGSGHYGSYGSGVHPEAGYYGRSHPAPSVITPVKPAPPPVTQPAPKPKPEGLPWEEKTRRWQAHLVIGEKKWLAEQRKYLVTDALAKLDAWYAEAKQKRGTRSTSDVDKRYQDEKTVIQEVSVMLQKEYDRRVAYIEKLKDYYLKNYKPDAPNAQELKASVDKVWPKEVSRRENAMSAILKRAGLLPDGNNGAGVEATGEHAGNVGDLE